MSKIGSPFEINVHGFRMTWDGERLKDVTGTTLEGETQLLQTARAEWTPKPPEGWERTESNDDEGMWNPFTGDVYPPDGIHYRCLGITFSKHVCECFGFVPVRKTKPAVPEWAKNLTFTIGAIPPQIDWHDKAGIVLAENCVPKADADEILPKLRRLHAYLSPGDLRDDVAVLIERMEGKR